MIADSSKRKAKPIGVLTWEPCPDSAQGRFSLEVASGCDEERLPLSLAFCASREQRRATPEESEEWVRSRIVPESRHNIGEVLAANGLTEYDEVGLLAACRGRSSDDDLLVYEIEMPQGGSGVAGGLGRAGGPGGPDVPAGEFGGPAEEGAALGGSSCSNADEIIAAIRRRRVGGEVRYAFVELRDEGEQDAESAYDETAAKRAGELIRAQRQNRGLTQRQLAARAGITQTVLSRVESGSGNPTLGLLEDLAGALDVRLVVSLDDAAPPEGR